MCIVQTLTQQGKIMNRHEYINKQMIFTGADDIQAKYAGNADPRDFFEEGEVLTVNDINIGNWSSMVEFKNFSGKWFNTVCFELTEVNKEYHNG